MEGVRRRRLRMRGGAQRGVEGGRGRDPDGQRGGKGPEDIAPEIHVRRRGQS